MRKIKVVLVAAAISAVTIVPLSAQLFGGMPVFDAAALAESIGQTGKLATQIIHAVNTYNEVAKVYNRATEHYNLAIRMSNYGRRIVDRYKTPSTAWRGMAARDSTGKGTNVRWLKSVNGGLDALDGWEHSVEDYQLKIDEINRGGHRLSDRQKREIASLEIEDGAGIVAMETLGYIRSNGVRTEPMLRELESDTLSDDPAMNTTADLAKRSNAISIVQARQAADTNKLLVNSVELALLRERRERESAAYTIAFEAARLTEGRAMLDSSRSGCAAESMMSFNPRQVGSTCR